MALKPLCAAGAVIPDHVLNLFQDLIRNLSQLLTPKLLLIMKLTAIILLSACLTVSARTNGQRISLSLKAVSLETVFKEIQKQSQYSFVYGADQISNAKKISIDVKNASLAEVLDICFKDQPFTYVIVDDNIVIKKKVESPNGPATEEPKQTPPIDIKGRITNEDGEPVAASIIVKGTQQGTTSNADGYFELKSVEENAVLLVTGISIEKLEIKVNGKTNFELTAKIKISPLDEMQVIAYGTKSKRYQTGNVSTVKAEDIAKQPVSNPLLALAGRVPGLFITQATGLPGSGVQVTVQGRNSINRGNNPFYVIDGVPYTAQLLPNYGSVLGNSSGDADVNGNPLSFLNPADIESISVLKDADATAIYGSRGANGVILITTKRGKAGQTRVDVNMQTGWGKVTRKLDLLNTQQYLEMRLEAKRNDNAAVTSTDYDINGFWDASRNTDWQKELIGNTAHYTDINATVSGGNSNTQILAGFGYHRETVVFPGDLSDQKGSLHFSMNNISTNQKFRFQLSGNYMEDNNRIIAEDLTQYAIRLAPNSPKIFNEDGTLNWMPNTSGTSSWSNPLAYITKRYKNKTKNLVGGAIISYQIMPGLDIKSSFGFTNMQANDVATTPLVSARPEDRLVNTQRTAAYSNNNLSSWIIEPQIVYRKTFGASRFDALLGSTIQQNTSASLRLSGSGYNSDVVLEDIKSASSITIAGTVNSVYKYNALFSRLGYTLFDKYLVNLTARRDGSSRFGPGNQFHNFGAIGAGWIFSKENFIQKTFPFISFGKLTGSYGTTGNDQIGDYTFMSLYFSSSVGVPYQGVNGIVPGGLSNAFLQWEETRKLYLALDLGLFKDRLIIGSSYFRNRSSNQLINYNIPIQTGFVGVYRNVPATVQNSGWEFTLRTLNINRKDFAWSFDFNLTIPKNKLLEFPGIEKTGFAKTYTVGEPITRTNLYRFVGVNPATGAYQFLDSKGNVTSSPSLEDQNFWVNTSPIIYGGLQNNLKVGNFELDFLFQFVKRKGRNYLFGHTNGAAFNTNQPISFIDRWQIPGDISAIQRYNSNFALLSQSFNAASSDDAYGDASFVRLKNLSLSWNMPQSWYNKAKLKNVRVYVQGQNLLTFTKYAGLDPETLSSTTLPPLRVITFGLQVGL